MDTTDFLVTPQLKLVLIFNIVLLKDNIDSLQRQYVFFQFFQLLLSDRLMRSVNFQHILHRIATTIIKIGSCTPAFVQCRNIHRQSLVRARCPAYLILFLIRIVLSGMAARTVFLKNLLSLLCLTGKFTVHKVWAWQR